MPVLVRRVLAMALLVAMLAGIWLFVVMPTANKFVSYRESITQSREILVRYRRIAAEREAVERILERARAARASTARFLAGNSTELVAAGLQNDVKKIIAANGGTLKSTQLLPHEDEQEWRKVTIRVNMNTDTEATTHVFHAIESANPYLFLANIQIRAPRKSIRSRAKAAKQAGQLQVRYDVYGYMQAREP